MMRSALLIPDALNSVRQLTSYTLLKTLRVRKPSLVLRFASWKSHISIDWDKVADNICGAREIPLFVARYG